MSAAFRRPPGWNDVVSEKSANEDLCHQVQRLLPSLRGGALSKGGFYVYLVDVIVLSRSLAFE